MVIHWDEIMSFRLAHEGMMAHQPPTRAKPKLLFDGLPMPTLWKTMQITYILRTLSLPTHGFVVTVCEIAATAWHAGDCSPVHVILDRNAFVDPIAQIAVTKANRQIIFLDVRTFKLISSLVSAAVVASAIPNMDLEEIQRVFVGCSCQDAPTTIYGQPDRRALYVGDCDGHIEVFEFFTDSGGPLAFRRLSLECLDGDAITQMTWLPKMEALVYNNYPRPQIQPSSLSGHCFFAFYIIGKNTPAITLRAPFGATS
jgi:hypothetical protein